MKNFTAFLSKCIESLECFNLECLLEMFSLQILKMARVVSVSAVVLAALVLVFGTVLVVGVLQLIVLVVGRETYQILEQNNMAEACRRRRQIRNLEGVLR